MASQLRLHIVSTERSLVDELVDEVEIPGVTGYFGVLPGHTPLLAQLGTGELWYRTGQHVEYLALSSGFAEVQPDRVTILAQFAERAGEIDVARASAARQRAEERLARPPAEMDYERARVAMMKALIRLQVAERVSSRARQ